MNDPHVEALHYKIQHGDHIDLSKAAGIEHELPDFALKASDGRLAVNMKAHFASVEEARASVDLFLRTWELDAALRYGPGTLKFAYDRADVIDRSPSPGVHIMVADTLQIAIQGGAVRMVVGLATYPAPPAAMSRDRIVDHMFTDYARYRNGGTKLGNCAHFCLTWLEEGAKPFRQEKEGLRKAASRRYSIAMSVLKELGRLGDEKGGSEGRKAHSTFDDYTSREKQWLETVIPTFIRRAAEVAYDPDAPHRQITLADLPPL